MDATPIRVLLADDHALFRSGVRMLIKHMPGIEVVGEAADGREAVRLAKAARPDVVLMDIAMPRGGTLIRGFGGTTLDESGMAVQTLSQTVELPDDGTRRKVIRLPFDVWDPAQGKHVEDYAFHHYFEIFRDGKRELSPVYSEEIVSREVEFADHQGTLGGMCIYWSIYDWDAPQYQPTEVPEFIEKYGEDNPYRSYKFYGSQDMEEFGRIRAEMLKALPLPRRFVGTIRGPKGAQVLQSWHVGGMWTPNRHER